MKRKHLLWALLICVLTIAEALETFALRESVIRPYAVILFLSICPGMVIAPLLPEKRLLVTWTFCVALSFTVDILLVTLFMYADWWSPTRIMEILLAFCGFGGIAHIAISLFSRDTSSARQVAVSELVPSALSATGAAAPAVDVVEKVEIVPTEGRVEINYIYETT